MFNLEKAISNWCSLLRSDSLAESDIAELESHLRDSMEDLSSMALSTEESFLIATFRLGDSGSLVNEFSKNVALRRNARFLPLTHVEQDGSVDEQVYAGFSRRLMACIFDLCIYWLAGVFLLYPISLLPLVWAVFAVVLLTLAFVVYVVSFTYCHGGTAGKILAGIRICRPDGSMLSLRQTFMRNAPYLFFALFALVFCIQVQDGLLVPGPSANIYLWEALTAGLLGMLWLLTSAFLLFRKKHSRTLHDYLADTIVVDEKYARVAAAEPSGYPAAYSVLA